MEKKSVYVYGDSILKGVVQGIEEGKEYSIYSENAVKVVSEKCNFDATNKSVFGNKIPHGHRILKKDLDNGIRPDVAVVEFGGNDCDYRWPELFEKGPENFHPNTPLPEFMNELDCMVNEIREAGIKPVLMTLPPLVGERYFEHISRGLNKEELLEWLQDPGFLYRHQELYSLKVAEYACKNDVFLIDLRTQFLQNRYQQSLMGKDGIHPNCEGHAFMADYFEKVCKENNFCFEE